MVAAWASPSRRWPTTSTSPCLPRLVLSPWHAWRQRPIQATSGCSSPREDRCNGSPPIRSTTPAPYGRRMGRRIYFRSNRSGVNALYVKAADGSGTETLVYTQPMEASSMIRQRPVFGWFNNTVHELGCRLIVRYLGPLAHAHSSGNAGAAVGVQRATGRAVARSALDGVRLRRDGDTTGLPPVVSKGELRRLVSSRGGAEPQWRRDGRELFFLDADRNLMAVSVSSDPDLLVGVPVLLFRTQAPVVGNPYRRPYAVSTDGQRFLVNTAPADAPPPAIQVVVDWRALLESSRR